MKKILLIFLISLITTNITKATDQQPDILFYGNEKLTVNIGCGHPSPLETYYQQNNLNYPFRMLHTANYRGHIATWKIIDDKFFITNIAIEEDNYKPTKFNVKSIDNTFSNDSKVFADWFSGVLVCQKRKKENYWKTEYSIYIYVKNGLVQKSKKITEKDFERIENLTQKDTADTNLMSKYSILYLNQSYISYYFRLHDSEHIEIGNKTGYLKGKNDYSVILEKYENSHFDWPYNWENFELSGAPNGTWKVIEDKLYLTDIHLNKGLNFDGPERLQLKLSEVFPSISDNSKILANWANGIYLASFGEEVADELIPELKSFKVKEFIIMRIESGNVVEKHTIPSEFDFDNIPNDANDKVKTIINDLKLQRE
ncbi:hypothetical protein P8625_02075 [Tenacibaculum tangerinum]|uniref:Uncharacterized protein n=1 Tax=Tenacibaculum tangerinum TaxID=3038772 RepID=A0ABY8L5S3_9FLAO|nr:hypothetical protein [Tenacibaculum tangerinum]WGH75977.1 hypothetical protein P8625_02075 [Tenacibaculum tangerinum]